MELRFRLEHEVEEFGRRRYPQRTTDLEEDLTDIKNLIQPSSRLFNRYHERWRVEVHQMIPKFPKRLKAGPLRLDVEVLASDLMHPFQFVVQSSAMSLAELGFVKGPT